MGIGLMNKKIWICSLENTMDQDGFSSQMFEKIKEVRAIVEDKHLNEKWSNSASFGEVQISFQFRAIPNFKIELEYYIEYLGQMYNIINVENVKGRDMYIEVLAKRLDSTNGKM